MGRFSGPLLVLIAAVAWSTAGLFTRVVSTDIPTTLFWRSLSGGICVFIIYHLLKRDRSLTESIRFSLGEVVTAVLSTFGMIFFIAAFFYTKIANVSFIYGAMPLITCVLAYFAIGTAITWLGFGASLLSAIGVAFMIWGASDLSDYVGLALAFGMTLFMAALTISAKYFPGCDMIKTSYLSAFLGALVMLPFVTFHNTISQDYLWLCLYGIVNVGLGFGLYLIGVSRTTALTAALLSLSEVPLAPIWAWLLFDERLGVETALGGTLIVVAAVMYIAFDKKNSESPAREPA
jgi:drug/metabolite transporter (DMT)-like permease